MIATKLRDQADKLTPKIKAWQNPAVAQYRITRRRAQQIETARLKARAAQRIQTALYGLADAHEAGTIKPSLVGIKQKVQIQELFHYSNYPIDDTGRKRLRKAKIDRSNFRDARESLLALVESKRDHKAEQTAKIRKAELNIAVMQSQKALTGYFPTPPDLIKLMLGFAEIEPDMRVLEPSAGGGHIADAIMAAHGKEGITLDVIEINPQLQHLLKLKGHNLILSDFTACYRYGEYDRILMNPPFERYQDMDHVQRAYKCLKSGGRLVAIISEGCFYRQDRKAKGFRVFLADNDAYIHPLPAGTFKTSGTSISTRLLVIDKELTLTEYQPFFNSDDQPKG